MTFVIAYPGIDPVLFAWGPLVIRWYALAYLTGLLVGWRYLLILARRPPHVATAVHIDNFLVWATLGVILGGRLGYVLFYKPGFFFDNPLAIPQVWLGGMSFHGGMLGIAIATVLFARQRTIPLFHFADLLACTAPIGLFLGRIANFINGELYGRASDVAWAMVFPRGGPLARHPSQLYEAVLEGAVLFTILYFLGRQEGLRQRAGFLTGVFLAGYAAARSIAELFRQPDAHLGFLLGGTTMGQWLSIPMLGFGLYLIVRRRRPG